MAHINIKPLSRTQVYETAEQAIYHVTSNQLWAQAWDWGGQAFGRTIDERRDLNAAVKANDASKFTAARRKGYWRVEYVHSAYVRQGGYHVHHVLHNRVRV